MAPVAPAAAAAVAAADLPVLHAALRFAASGLSGSGRVLLVGRRVLQLLDGQVAGLVVGVAHGLRGRGEEGVGGGGGGGGGGVGGVVGVGHDVHRVLVGQVGGHGGGGLRQAGGGQRRGVAVADVHVLLVLEGVVQGLAGAALRGAGVLEPVDDVGEVQRAAAFARVQVVQLAHVAHHLLARRVLVVLEPLLQPRDLVLGVERGPDAGLAGGQDGGVRGRLQRVALLRVAPASGPVRQKLGLMGSRRRGRGG